MESEDLSLDVLAGARYLYVNSPVQVNYNKKIEESGNAWDGIVGFRAKYDLNEKWFTPLHFDVGTGEIDLTWHVFAGVGYKYDNWDVVAGYRHLEFKFDDSDDGGEVFDSITISGPMVGFKYHF
jgi:lipopolysaccharide assembly outer membrane protein LptD (OstA)